MLKTLKIALVAAIATTVLATASFAAPATAVHHAYSKYSPALTGGGSVGYNRATEYPN